MLPSFEASQPRGASAGIAKRNQFPLRGYGYHHGSVSTMVFAVCYKVGIHRDGIPHGEPEHDRIPVALGWHGIDTPAGAAA